MLEFEFTLTYFLLFIQQNNLFFSKIKCVKYNTRLSWVWKCLLSLNFSVFVSIFSAKVVEVVSAILGISVVQPPIKRHRYQFNKYFIIFPFLCLCSFTFCVPTCIITSLASYINLHVVSWFLDLIVDFDKYKPEWLNLQADECLKKEMDIVSQYLRSSTGQKLVESEKWVVGIHQPTYWGWALWMSRFDEEW